MTNDELKAIIEDEVRRAGGELKPEQLVKRAKAKGHPLHDDIWGISQADAAMNWRIDLARKLISSVWVNVPVKNEPEKEVRVKFMLPSTRTPHQESGFRRFADVAEDRVESYATLEAELKALCGHYMRAMNIAAGLGLTEEAESMVSNWDASMGQFAARGVVVPVEKRRRGDAGEGARA